MSERGLTPKQAAFVREFAVDYNATRAAVRAGYSERTAAQIGYQLLQKTSVQVAIRDVARAHSEATALDAGRVAREVALLAHSRLWHYRIGDDGSVALAEGAPPDAIAAVQSIKKKVRQVGELVVEREVEIKLWSKPDALRLAMQHLGMLKELHEHTGKGGGPIRVAAVREMSDDDLARIARAGLPGGGSAGTAGEEAGPD